MRDLQMNSTASYVAFDAQSLAHYPELAKHMSGSCNDWTIRELGDGNLNLVFLVESSEKSLIIKQAVPYLRVVGTSWPLTVERSYFESQALKIQSQCAAQYVPAVYHTDRTLGLIIMEHLSEHIIMRKGIVKGIYYPQFSESIAAFMAHTLFYTSDLALKADKKKALMGLFCANVELCKITEDLIFTDPYYKATTNRWTTPELDTTVQQIQNHEGLKIAISELKDKFLNSPQALIHGDLHTGSIMLNQDDMRVIDPEFAFYGPMGFDIGMLLANLLMGYFSQDGHSNPSYAAWLLDQVETIWKLFYEKFLSLWNNNHSGDLYPSCLVANPYVLQNMQQRYMQRLLQDTVGFMAAEIIRRILGLAHTLELDSIQDQKKRAACERRALELAIDMLLQPACYETVSDITQKARALHACEI